MGLFKWFGLDTSDKEIKIYNSKMFEQIVLYENAINRCVSIISKMCSKCEIEYYKNENGKIKSIKNDTYYKLNIKANQNETASELLNKFFSNLLKNNEALIIPVNKNLYVADDWTEGNQIFNEKIYSNIKISDSKGITRTLYGTYYANEVIYVNLNDENIEKINNKLFNLYANYIEAASDNFIYNNVSKWRLTPPNTTIKIKDSKTGKELNNDEYKNKISDGLLDKKSSLIMMQENFKLEHLNDNKSVNSTDFLNLKNEFNNEIASNYHLSLDIFYLNKDVSKESFNNFITFAVDPILELFEDRLNFALIKKEDYLKGDRIYIARHKFRHQDILDVASSINLLFGDGYSHNEINGFMNLPPIDEEWANKHHITKNVEDATNLKGGDESE